MSHLTYQNFLTSNISPTPSTHHSSSPNILNNNVKFLTRQLDTPGPVEGDRWQVEHVLLFRFKPVTRQPQDEVKWKGYEHKDNSWINAEDIDEQEKQTTGFMVTSHIGRSSEN